MLIFLVLDDPLLAGKVHECLRVFEYPFNQASPAESRHFFGLRERTGIHILACERDDFLLKTARLRSAFAPLSILAIGDFDDSPSRVRALLAGADACLPRDFESPELAAILHAFQRQQEAAEDPALSPRPGMPELPPPAGPGSPADTAEADTWRLSPDCWLLQAPSGVRLKLSRTERQLFVELHGNPGKPVGAAPLAHELGATDAGDAGQDDRIALRTLTVMISRLRKRASATGMPLPLKNVRQEGYIFCGRLVQG